MSRDEQLVQQTRDLLQTKLKNVRKAALAAALVPLAVVAVGQATPADAQQMHRVRAKVTQAEQGQFKYEFTLVNASMAGASGGNATGASGATDGEGPARPWIVDWQLPLYAKEDVANVKVPEGWAFEIIAPTAETEYYNKPNSPYGKHAWAWSTKSDLTLQKGDKPDVYGGNPAVFTKPPFILHFYAKSQPGGEKPIPVNPVGSLELMSGFEFTSKYDAINAPFVPVYYNQQDPAANSNVALIPNSPAFQKALNTKVSSAN